MASLRAPGLGPIIGATTDKTCRIWIRAGDPGDSKADLDADRRTIGVVGIVNKDGKKIDQAWYFRLQREYDRTGTFKLGEDVAFGRTPGDLEREKAATNKQVPPVDKPTKLKADTPYKIRVGTLTIDDPFPNDVNLPDWRLRDRLPDIDMIKDELLLLRPTETETVEATFRTFPQADKISERMSFLLGSCRYPGLLWKIKEADRIFGPMQKHFELKNDFGEPARFTMMCGDQIYADMLHRLVPILRADSYEEFQERYHTAFGAQNLRKLLSSATTYMILDDHEIEDNWTQDRLKKDGKHQLFNIAISAYMSYQWIHSPRNFGRPLYYNFDCGGYPFFVLDTRTQRYKDDAVGMRDNHLLGRPTLDQKNHPGQLQHLLDWLSHQQKKLGNVPKLIVTACVFAPNAMDERIDPDAEIVDDERANPPPQRRDDEYLLYLVNKKRRDDSDSWPAYPNTRLAILERILKEKIQNVIFLSGDIHCSNIAELKFNLTAGGKVKDDDGDELKAFSVTSSAFYWPFPFADGDPNSYVHDSTKEMQIDVFPIPKAGAWMTYRSYGYTQEDNFARLDIDRKRQKLKVRIFNSLGEVVRVDDRDGKLTKENVLSLAKW